MDLDVEVRASGPVVDGAHEPAVQGFLRDAPELLAQEGVDAVRAEFGPRFKAPSGRYLSRIVVERATTGRAVVSDGGIVYGPWLEGTGSRNARTRFKGYRGWRLAKQRLEARADQVVEPASERMMRRLEG